MASINTPASMSTETPANVPHVQQASTPNPDHVLQHFPDMTQEERAAAVRHTISALSTEQLQATLSAFLGGRNKNETMSKIRKPDTYDGKDIKAAVQWKYQVEQYVKSLNLPVSFDQIRLACSYLVGECTPFVERTFNQISEGTHVMSLKNDDDDWFFGSWEWFMEEFTNA